MKNQKQEGKSRLWIRLAVLVLLIIAIYSLFRFTSLKISDFKPGNIKAFIQRFGTFAPVIFIIIYALRAVILVLPVGVMSLAGGLAFGKWFGTLYILIGATAGSCLSFLLARYLGRSFIEKLGVMKKGKLKKFDESIENNGFRVILFMRLVPLFQYDALNFGSGLSKMKFRDYVLGTFIGMIPGGFINAFLGSSLDNIISTQFFVALGFFIMLMFIPTIYKKLKKKKENRTGKAKVGKCPTCNQQIGPIAVIKSWDKGGNFVCPSCGAKLKITSWILFALLLLFLFFLVERLLAYLLITNIPLWTGFLISTVLACMVLIIMPMIWKVYSGGK